MNCPKCFSPLEPFRNKYICSNDSCDYVIKAEELKNKPSQWTEIIYKNDELWYKEVFDTYPSVIAHEYYRVYDMMGHNQSYGSFWQLKDLLEVLLKFPVLSAASQVFNRDRDEYTPKEEKILKILIGKTLSLGDWLEMASNLKGIQYIHRDIKKILSDITELYNKNGIVHWRNKQIGHGALPMDTDAEFQREIVNILSAVKKHFLSCDDSYRAISVHPEGKDYLLLKGRHLARDINHDSCKIELCLKEGKVELFPYILLYNRGIYFYDTYYSIKKKTAILDYPDGKKDDDNTVVNDAIQGKYGDFLVNLIDDEGSIDDKTYSLQDELLIEQIGKIDDFLSPSHLKNWLQKNMEQYDRGIFLLQMERGTGKTTFARGLDELSIGKVKLKDTSVRGYYINNTYKHKDINFRQGISDAMKKSSPGVLLIRGIEDLTNRVTDKGQEFARFLNEYNNEYTKRFSTGKLMVILDDMDEIPAGDNIQIFDYIPLSNMLAKGVYILLTCRTDEELKPYTLQRLKAIDFTDSISLYRDGKYNQELLKDYIKTKIFKLRADQEMSKTQETTASHMIKKAGGRFLYLKTLKELMLMNPSISLKDDNLLGNFPEGNDLFGCYLDKVESLYGKKYFCHIYGILVILATSFEPLTLREISYLLGEDRPTFRVLAYMEELKGFLSIERSERGNLFSIGHEEWIDFIKNRFGEKIHEMVISWADKVKGLKDKKVDWEKEIFDGEVYIASTISQYLEEYSTQDLYGKFAAGDFSIFFNIAKRLYQKSGFKYHQYRALSLLSTCEKLLRYGLREAEEKKIGIIRDSLSLCLDYKGSIYINMNYYPEALKALDEALIIFKQNQGHESYNLNQLADRLMGRGDAHENMENFREAMADHREVLAILLDLKESGKLEHKEAIVRAYTSIADVYYDTSCYKEAADAYTKGMEIIKRLAEEGKPVHYNIEAYLLTSRGECYDSMGDSQKALEDYNEALRIRTELDSKGMLKDKNQIGLVLSNRSITYRDVDPKKSLEDINQAINILKSMENQGKPIDSDSLVYRLRLRAKTYRALDDYVNAQRDYEEAFKILKSITEDDDWNRKNNLADLYDDFAHNYLSLNDNDKAAEYFEMKTALQEELERENRLFESGDLTVSWYNFGVTQETLKKYEEAVNCYTKSIEHARKMKSKDKHINEVLLIKAIISRSAMYLNIGKYKSATESYDEAIWELSEFKPAIQENEYIQLLAKAYSGKGNALKANKNYKDALECTASSVMLMEDLRGRGNLIDKIDLIAAMYDRADIYNILGHKEKAIDDLKAAVKLFFELDSSSAFWGENWLINAIYLTGEIYYTSEEFSQGITHFTKLLQYVNSNDTRTWILKYREAVYSFRGILFVKSGEYERAVEDFTEYIEINKKLELGGNRTDPMENARDHTRRAYAYLKLDMGDEAVYDFKDALCLFYQWADKRNKKENDELLNCAVQLTQALQELGRFDESKSVMERAVSYAEGMDIKGSLPYCQLHYLAAGYYEEKRDIKKQQEHLCCIIDMLTGCNDSDAENDNIDYAGIYNVLSEAFIDLNLTGDNIKYMDKLIGYTENLKCKGLIYNLAPLGEMYMNRGIMYHNIGEDEKAMTDYSASLDIIEKIYNEGSLEDISDLALVYLNMSLASLSMKRYEDTISSAQKALSLWEEADSKDVIEEGRIVAYINLGDSFYNIKQYEKADLFYNIAVGIYQDIRSEREIDYKDVLIKSFESCCMKYKDVEKIIAQLKS